MRRRKKKYSTINKNVRTVLTIIIVLAALFGGSRVYNLDTFTQEFFSNSKAETANLKPTDRLTGKIIRVSDGDTVVLLDSLNKQHKIRLNGIDCPETGQDFGAKATKFTKELCMGKYTIVDVTGIDKYQRILGIVWVDDINVNEELLKNGLAWRYMNNKSPHYLELEQKARLQRINIWSMKQPLAPWDFRKSK